MNRASHTQSPAPVFVTAVYASKYAAFIAPLLDSIRTHAQSPRGIVLYQDIPLRELNVLAHAYPEFEFVHHDFPTSTDVMHSIPRKFHAWTEGARRFADSPVLFLDIDTVLMRPIHDLFEGDWDLLFTWKDELFPINTGVMAARKGEAAVHVFTAMLTRIERIIASKLEFHQAVGSSGAVDQHALREIIGFCNYDATFYRPVTANGQTREIVFRGEPCRLFNETNCRAIDNDLRIVHYKTGWHPILLENADFTKNRPAAACTEMFKHWHHLEQHASEHVAKALTIKSARANIDRFLDIAGGYEERGILHSEMLAVCAVSASLDVDVVIESGRCRGQSTLVLSRFFENTKTKIVSIEWIKDENAAFAEQRLAPYKNVELLYGSAERLLPTILERYPNQRVALLLDGPKGQEAVDLARDGFNRYPQLHAAFIHDMRIDTPQRPAALKEPMRTFFTDDESYLKEFSSVDEACLPRQGEPITVHTWRPYMKGEERIPAYGPTLGVFLPRPAKHAIAPPTS